MTMWQILIVCWVMKATHILMLYNIYFFSTATVVARMCFSFTFKCTMPVLFTVN
jgi:hypothetical protein